MANSLQRKSEDNEKKLQQSNLKKWLKCHNKWKVKLSKTFFIYSTELGTKYFFLYLNTKY